MKALVLLGSICLILGHVYMCVNEEAAIKHKSVAMQMFPLKTAMDDTVIQNFKCFNAKQ